MFALMVKVFAYVAMNWDPDNHWDDDYDFVGRSSDH